MNNKTKNNKTKINHDLNAVAARRKILEGVRWYIQNGTEQEHQQIYRMLECMDHLQAIARDRMDQVRRSPGTEYEDCPPVVIGQGDTIQAWAEDACDEPPRGATGVHFAATMAVALLALGVGTIIAIAVVKLL